MRRKITALAGLSALLLGSGALASNHLDTPTAKANPQANIGDLYAWMTPDGKRLNLVMDIVGRSFSDKLDYVLHIDSGRRLGATSAGTTILCRIHAADDAECRLGSVDEARGDARDPAGLEGRNHRFKVFAGLRDDPFFNNVRGTRAALQTAIKALPGSPADGASCPRFDLATVAAIRDQWRHTAGGDPGNFLAGWTSSALVVSVDRDAVAQGGRLLAIWASTATPDRQLDRAGRPMMKNALLGLLLDDAPSDALKEDYNQAIPATAARFIPEIEKSLAFYDGLDGECGNQLLADRRAPPSRRYRALATLFADDRLWVDSGAAACTQLFAVERGIRGDRGGRRPDDDTANIFRSLLVDGSTSSVTDGVRRDEHPPSVTAFPFLVAPAGPPVESYPYGKD